ncbi:transcription termination factor MTERF2, chloroplastic isoform X1 [Telopea speciosissima]|uniref:transcription termination factor MTERF2, chloroplastic isoform X1 n=1 Tax=Telopea speciosissima TaxID=54955 RepID=UPI001CC4C041|nr:transcription termination factor MTERF2, chloroplastic isoform X1 [Telopea speciosissima]
MYARNILFPIPKTVKTTVSNDGIYIANLSCNHRFHVKISNAAKSYSEFSPLRRLQFSDTLRRASTTEHCGNSNDEWFVDAQDAVSEIIQESGLSKEESVEIALNSPKYVKMLMDSVRDLDEHSLWKSWEIENEDVGSLPYKRKVFYMAKKKGDNGLLPYLESIGLNPSSSTYVARYLSRETLPDLISKVKYVKEMFFFGSDDEDFIGKNARRMMMHLSITTDEDIQQTLSFFEKMEARRGGLKLLGSKDASFRYLIESFPRLLLLSVESHLKPLVEFLQNVGVPKKRIRMVLLLFPPIIFYDIERDITLRVQSLEKVGVANKDIGRMLLKYPWILSTSVLENLEEILSYLDMEKVPKAHVETAIKSWPHLLGCSTSKIKYMVEQFEGLGIKNKKLGQVIASSPQLLLRKPHEFLEMVLFMEELGLDAETIGRIMSRCPEIFASSIERTLRRKVKFLADIGISRDHLPRVIRKYPELLVSDIDSALLPRIRYLMRSGLSKREVASMVRRFSPLLGYSIEEVLRPKLEFLVNTMEKPVRDVVEYPRYFSYSLDKKIKPRFWVLKGRNVDCSLKDMLGKNDEDFATDYMGIGRMLVPPPSSQE